MNSVRAVFPLMILPVLLLGAAQAEEAPTRPMKPGTFHMKVETLKVDGQGFTLALRGSDSAGSKAYHMWQSSQRTEDMLIFLRHLVEGKEYDFPQVFEEVFGKDYEREHASLVAQFKFSSAPAALFPTAKLGPADGPGQSLPKSLFDLNSVPRFRAKVTGRTMNAVLAEVTLEANDGRKMELKHAPGTTEAEARRFDVARSIVAKLEEGRTYEFPEVVEYPDQAGFYGTGAAGAATEEMRALEGFIGEWESVVDGAAKFSARVRYSWSSDGKAMWRVADGQSEGRTFHQETRCWYDSASKCYLDATTNPLARPAQLHGEWDAAGRTLKFSETFSIGTEKRSLKATRTVESADRISWTSVVDAPDGKKTESSGSYTRVKG